MRIFIVEDSLVVLERLRNLINGIKNTELSGDADNETDAVRNICIVQPDMVILDLVLNSGSGMEVLRKIKSENFPVKVIVLTNYFYPQYREKCQKLGADYFLDKSQEIGTLGELLCSLAEKSHPAPNYPNL